MRDFAISNSDIFSASFLKIMESPALQKGQSEINFSEIYALNGSEIGLFLKRILPLLNAGFLIRFINAMLNQNA